MNLHAPGIYLRCPGGNVERPDLHRLASSWAALNIGGDPCVGRDPAKWNRQRQLYRQAGFPHFPWLHCRTLADVEHLIATGIAWLSQGAAPVIGLNLEDVARDGLSLQQVSGLVQDFWVNPHGGQVHLPTLPWVQNGQGWHHLAYAVFALEIMPDEQNIFPGREPDPTIVSHCVEHAFAEGAREVTLMLKTKGYLAAEYADVVAASPALYTGDDIPPLEGPWASWHQPSPCARPTRPAPPPPPPPGGTMLTTKQFPYTGPFHGPSYPQGPTRNRPTIKGIKRGLIRLKYLDQELGKETDDFGAALERALRLFQRDRGVVPAAGQYGRLTWMELRQAKLASGPNRGQYAMDALALKYVREDAITMCHPHALGPVSTICQDLHETLGLGGNWAIDFCAPAGTKVLAVERATVKKLSGRDPALGVRPGGIFGWSVHYETPAGYRYFSTHYGTRAVQVGQIVDVGDVIGTVGNWPGNAHTHLGVTSPYGVADAKKRITAVKNAVRLAA